MSMSRTLGWLVAVVVASACTEGSGRRTDVATSPSPRSDPQRAHSDRSEATAEDEDKPGVDGRPAGTAPPSPGPNGSREPAPRPVISIAPRGACNKAECGPAPGMPNWKCADGTGTGGPRCARREDGTCHWAFHQCPTP